MSLRATYRGKPGSWEAVIKDGKRVVWACGHAHHNRDHSTNAHVSAGDCGATLLHAVVDPGRAARVLAAMRNGRPAWGEAQMAHWHRGLAMQEWAIAEATRLGLSPGSSQEQEGEGS